MHNVYLICSQSWSIAFIPAKVLNGCTNPVYLSYILRNLNKLEIPPFKHVPPPHPHSKYKSRHGQWLCRIVPESKGHLSLIRNVY